MDTISTALTTTGNTQAGVTSDRPDIEHILAGRLTASSIAIYKRDVQAYLEYAAKEGLDWKDHKTLMAFRDRLATESTMSPNTINRMLSAVKRIVKEMAKRELIDANMALQFKQVDGVQIKALKDCLKQNASGKCPTK
jgi:site-specific recombinase XerD